MPSVELSAGTIEYSGTGGDGPPFVLLHGLAMDGALWREVVARLDSGPRCVVPTLPFGAHRVPMRRDADLSLRGIGRIVAELLDALHLHDPALADDRTAAPAPVHVRNMSKRGVPDQLMSQWLAPMARTS